MLENQKKYIAYLENLKSAVSEIESIDKENQDILIEEMQNAQLLVPIVGSFSAGKSTLINVFLEKTYLPTGITPETSLATQLHFSANERIEAIQKDGSQDDFAIDDWQTIKENAQQYKYIKLYVNNEKLKSIEPLILVDMPGFESPLDLHNQAILEYIDKGSYYVVLTSVEDGTITHSMLRQLGTLSSFNKDFAFFLSKSDLRPDNEIKNIQQNIQEQLSTELDLAKTPISVNYEAGDGFDRIIKSLDPQKLFDDLFLEILKQNYQSIHENLNVLTSSAKKDKQKNEDFLQEIKDSIKAIESKKNQMLKEANEKYSNTNVDSIVNDAGNALSSQVEELANTLINHGEQELSSSISNIVSNAIMHSTEKSLKNISLDIRRGFSKELDSINKSMSEFSLSEDWLKTTSDNIQKFLDSGVNALDNLVKERKQSTNINTPYKIITTLLAVTTNIAAPVVEVLAIFLPEIIDFFAKKIMGNRQKEEIKTQLLTNVIPSVKQEVREKLTQIFNEHIVQVIEEVGASFEAKLEEKRLLLEKTQNQYELSKEEIEQTIATYEQAINEIKTLTQNTLY